VIAPQYLTNGGRAAGHDVSVPNMNVPIIVSLVPIHMKDFHYIYTSHGVESEVIMQEKGFIILSIRHQSSNSADHDSEFPRKKWLVEICESPNASARLTHSAPLYWKATMF
jgi:hypothetical protein